jgi:pilus assembly protein CpaE
MRLLREQRGQTSVELVGMLWWMLLAALVVWQLMLAAWAVNQTANAARTASRIEGRGGDAEKAARNALPGGLRDGMKVKISGETAKVSVRIPIVVPGLGDDRLRASRSATLPG